MANKQRSHAFDLLCGICILRMVTLHTMQMVNRSNVDWWVVIMNWTYFFMCFFFFKAGYFNKSVAGNSRQYITDKAKRLLIPYFSWGFISLASYAVYYFWLTAHYGNPIEEVKWSHVYQVSGWLGNNPLWFLFSFFMAYFCIHFIEKVRHLHWIILIFPLISYWLYRLGNPLWMSGDNIFLGIFFFYLGQYWHRFLNWANTRWAVITSIAMLAAFGIFNTFWHSGYSMFNNEWNGLCATATHGWVSGSFGAILSTLAMVCALCGLSGILLLARLPRIPLIGFIGEHSMVYFVMHYIIIQNYKLFHLAFGRGLWNHGEEAFILLPFILITCSWLVPYVEAIPWLSGRFKKKKDSMYSFS